MKRITMHLLGTIANGLSVKLNDPRALKIKLQRFMGIRR